MLLPPGGAAAPAQESEWGCAAAGGRSTFLPGEKPEVRGRTSPGRSSGSRSAGHSPGAALTPELWGLGSLSVKWGTPGRPAPSQGCTRSHEGRETVGRELWALQWAWSWVPTCHPKWPTPAASTGGGRGLSVGIGAGLGHRSP